MAAVRRHRHHHRSVTHRASRHVVSRGRRVTHKHTVHHSVAHHHGKRGHTIVHTTTHHRIKHLGKPGHARPARRATTHCRRRSVGMARFPRGF